MALVIWNYNIWRVSLSYNVYLDELINWSIAAVYSGWVHVLSGKWIEIKIPLSYWNTSTLMRLHFVVPVRVCWYLFYRELSVLQLNWGEGMKNDFFDYVQ